MRRPALVSLGAICVSLHSTPPLGPLHRNETTNQVLDRYNKPIELYKDVPEILCRIRKAGVLVAACSRTSAPKLCVNPVYSVNVVNHHDSARQALNLLLIPSPSDDDSVQPAIEFFDQLEIYPGMFPV